MNETELLKPIDRDARENATSLNLPSKNIKTIPPAIAYSGKQNNDRLEIMTHRTSDRLL
jgi:hypothetical protein